MSSENRVAKLEEQRKRIDEQIRRNEKHSKKKMSVKLGGTSANFLALKRGAKLNRSFRKKVPI